MLLVCGASACQAESTLRKVIDIPVPGRVSRFDYQSFDPTTRTLYFTHMGDGELVVFDTMNWKVVAHLPGFPTATGVLVVPELHRLFVSVAGRHEVAVVDTGSLKVLARVGAGDFPDGLAYVPDAHKVSVSDESGGMETVIDTNTNQRIDTIEMGGEVGNTQYDPGSRRLYVATESKVVSVFDLRDGMLTKLEDLAVGPRAHTVSVNPENHEVYLPLEDVGGHPVLRILKPASP